MPIRALTLVACIALSGCALPGAEGAAASARGSWRTDMPMPQARAAHAVVSTGNVVYVLGGTGDAGAPVLPVDRFDGTAWTRETTLPGAGLNAPAAALVDERIYVIGGFEADTNLPSARVLVYDLAARRWSEVAPLPAPRGGHAAVVIGGRIHVIGGGNERSTIADHDVYDPARNAWTAAAPLPRSEGSPAGVVLHGKLYAIGGRSGSADFGEVYVFDTATGSWSTAAPITPRGTAGAVVQCAAIVLAGGESQARRASLDEVLELDATGRWRTLPSMPAARNFARAVPFGRDILVLGGSASPEPSHASIGSTTVQRFTRECPPQRPG